MNVWENNAMKVDTEYGAYVDGEERFYICPECEELIYESDWGDEDLIKNLCPICQEI